jgi:hypothetical protein
MLQALKRDLNLYSHTTRLDMSEPKTLQTCGIVMPISTIDGCSESHWSDVLEILTEAIEQAGFEGNLVSNADDVGIIQKRIIQNLYENPIVVCDVSGKNPNVMFELGMRLAFDKPTIIVKDDRTSYSFDTSPIEHLEYPRDLRFSRVVDFKQKLAEKLRATYEKAETDGAYTTFLKHFGEFKVAKLDKKEVSGQEYIIDELKTLRMSMRRMERNLYSKERSEDSSDKSNVIDICLKSAGITEAKLAIKELMTRPDIIRVEIVQRGPEHYHLFVSPTEDTNHEEIKRFVRQSIATLRPRIKRTPSNKETT